MNATLVIAIVGAESTGKTALAESLAERIAHETDLTCTWVGEHLRDWCAREGRTPRPGEQAAIAQAQQAAIERAAARHAVVVCDTTPLMTAVYSRLLFGDDSLVPAAVDFQRRCSATLLTALDLPWVADGLQRDGPQVREPVDTALRELLVGHGLGWSLVAGQGTARVEHALDAVAPLLRPRLPTGAGAGAGRGLFTRLAARNAADKPWRCELCDDPACERRSLHGAG